MNRKMQDTTPWRVERGSDDEDLCAITTADGHLIATANTLAIANLIKSIPELFAVVSGIGAALPLFRVKTTEYLKDEKDFQVLIKELDKFEFAVLKALNSSMGIGNV